MSRGYLCIGGPLDGQYYAAHEKEDTFIIKRFEGHVLHADYDETFSIPSTMFFSNVYYKLQPWYVGGEHAFLWVTDNLSSMDVFTLLVESYSKVAQDMTEKTQVAG